MNDSRFIRPIHKKAIRNILIEFSFPSTTSIHYPKHHCRRIIMDQFQSQQPPQINIYTKKSKMINSSCNHKRPKRRSNRNDIGLFSEFPYQNITNCPRFTKANSDMELTQSNQRFASMKLYSARCASSEKNKRQIEKSNKNIGKRMLIRRINVITNNNSLNPPLLYQIKRRTLISNDMLKKSFPEQTYEVNRKSLKREYSIRYKL